MEDRIAAVSTLVAAKQSPALYGLLKKAVLARYRKAQKARLERYRDVSDGR